MKLELNIFRFDCKRDYLPYYTKHFIKIQEEKTLLDIFNKISTEDSFCYEDNENFCVVVNGLYCKVCVHIEKLVEVFGKDLIIEPLSIRRATKDLLIDDKDFKEKIHLLSKFISKEDEQNYLKNRIYFYASNTLNFQYDYIGDALLLQAHQLIEKNPENKEEILKIIKNHEYGIQYHTSLENKILDFNMEIEEKINQIKNELHLIKNIEEQNFCVDKKIDIAFPKSFQAENIKYDFKDFNLAYYYGQKEDLQTKELLSKLKAKIIDLDNKNIDLNLNSFHLNQTFIFKLASSILLEAFDKGADLLIVDDENIFKLFEINRKSLSKVYGREVIIPILHKSELAFLAYGKHEEVKQLLKKHQINPEII